MNDKIRDMLREFISFVDWLDRRSDTLTDKDISVLIRMLGEETIKNKNELNKEDEEERMTKAIEESE